MNEEWKKEIIDNVSRVRERINQASRRSNRNPDEIDLVAVTKEKSAVAVKALLENGIHQIGESYLKEALFKIDLLNNFDVEWHMIGNIQSGKEKNIARLFTVVHSVSKLGTAEKLSKNAGKINKVLPVYAEINVSGEDTKGGWPAWREEQWEGLIPEFEQLIDMKSLQVMGLMTMAPYSSNPQDARPYFINLRRIRDYISRNISGADLEGLSMGMSGDFEVAIEEGATVLRIGSALVGTRN